MTYPIETIAAIAALVLVAYTIVGLTGFGASITAMPFLVQLVPLTVALPLMLVYDLCAGLAIGLRNREQVDRAELARLLPFAFLGIVLGVTLLVSAPESALLLVLGLFVLAYAGWNLLWRPVSAPIARGWVVPIGTIGGVFSALFGTGGPIYTIYLARRIGEKGALRATIMTVVLASALARLVSLLFAGLFRQPGLFPLIGTVLPFALAGMFVGGRLHRRLPAARVIQAIWLVLIVGGVMLVWRALA